MATTTIPPTFYQVAFNADPNQAAIPPYWTDQSWRVQFPWSSARGRQYELDAVETGEWRPTLANPDGALDPSNSASPYSPNVIPFRQARVICKPGPNALTPDQATAGEATGYPPGISAPAQMNISNDFGYTVTLAASGTAYQGSQVYQVTLPGGATQFTSVLLVKPAPVMPAVTYSFSAQVRIPSGTSTPTSAALLWFDATGASISSTAGATVTPTSGSSSWVQVAVSGTAPANAYSATLKIQIASGGSTGAPTTWQADGLQFEQNPFPTPYQTPFTLSTNLFPGNLASGGYDTQSATGWWYPTAGSTTYATGLAAAPTGHTNAFAWTTPASTTSTSPLLAGAASSGPVADNVQVTATGAYSATFYALRSSSADATLTVTPTLTWYSATGASISSVSGTPVTLSIGTWNRLAVSGTAPAGALWTRFSIAITAPASTTASNTVYLTAGQFEAAASPTSWRDTGATYSVITPMIERWPQTWTEQDGTYGTSDVIGDDAFAALSQYTLAAPFIEEVLAAGPDFFYPLSDPAGSTSCADASGKRVAAPVENAPFGAGSLTFGSSVTSANAGQAFTGSAGPVATFANNATANPPTQVQFAETFVSLHKTTSSPGLPASGPWTRIIAFRASAAPGTNKAYTLWDAEPASWATNASLAQFAINSLGQANIQWSDFHGTSAWDYTGTANLCDGNWHLLAMGNDPVATGTVIWVDGVVVSTSPGTTGLPAGFATDVLGCAISTGRNWYNAGHIGDLAFAAQFPVLLTSTQMTNLYTSWRTASSGESSGARMTRILKWVGWSGPSAIDTGATTSMGPATDLTGAAALDAANSVTLTENGNWYAAANGTLTFKARTARYNQLTPAFIFGENTAVGEWPFEVLQFDYDPSHIANNVQVTQFGGSVYTALDAASGSRFFPRVYQRTINATSVNECQDAANYLLGQYKDSHLRVSALRLHASAVPGLLVACLNLELGTRIRVNRRPNGAPQITFNGFVEKIEWEWDPEGPEVFVNLQCSPADLASYWLLAALHTAVNTQVTNGSLTAKINALPDSAVNALSQSLPSGYQLTFDPGTPIAETMTIAPGGIPATNPGYSNATLTFTSSFAFTHAAGAIVCEPLPAGVSDPTTYDAASTLGAAYATMQAQTSGTNLITINQLPDGKVNGAGSDWNTGDVLWIGPGTANFEGYNLLHPNISTAGEGVLPLAAGTAGTALGLSSDVGTPSVTASGTAFQGANVWQVSVAGGVVPTKGLLYVLKVPVTPGLAYTASEYVRSATSAANPTVQIYLKFLDSTGTSLAQTNSGSTVLTGSPTAAWTRMTVTATAPAGTAWAQIGLLLTATAPGSAWSFQADGLQLEQNGTASAYQTAPQVKSITGSVAGYSTATITLAQNLANSHAGGEWVCDPLPPGTTNPSTVAANSRLAY
ncbi:hypothetical protein [Actinocrinis sp.]|uniref:hypothetical protein n=1 Tax=Actinocrinis sp. TaxID=1920516 RepID=UPI002D5971C3|nr:hypothetical protein [Actinocrinis sp.]HZP55028.1 hypothetical protein [Actinocrinis sp.]